MAEHLTLDLRSDPSHHRNDNNEFFSCQATDDEDEQRTMMSTSSSAKDDHKSSEAYDAPTLPPRTQKKHFASLPEVLLGHHTSDSGDVLSSPITLKNR